MMKKQKQNISASLDGTSQESHPILDSQYGNSDFLLNKREREATIEESSAAKKQREDFVIKNEELNIPKNINNNCNLNSTNQSPMLNIINNSHTGNLNLNNFINPGNYLNNQIYSGYNNITNFTPNTNSTYNIYQNLSHGMSQVYTSNYYNNPNKLLGSLNSYNYGKIGMTNYTNYNIPGYYSTGLTGLDPRVNQVVQTSQQNLTSQQGDQALLTKSGEKKKYVIQDMPGMTVWNYLQNKDTKTNYLNAIQKKEGEVDQKEPEVVTEIETVKKSSFGSNFTSAPSNLIVVESKTVPPSENLVKNVSSNLSGNVITFNKPPNTQQVQKNSSATTSTSTSLPIKSGDFCASLQKYIQRAYQKCQDEHDRMKCQKALMKIMTAALNKGDLNTRDWNKHPLPILPSELGQTHKTEVNEVEIKNREKRKGRFTLDTENTNVKLQKDCFDELTNNVTIFGTCQSLEKQYLRLTSIPDPSQVRPESVLKLSLKMLKDKWKNKQADYNYISEQFRSIRQDMTIQHIKNDFTVKVYETHARIALESLDLDQFNQCQTALISLYSSGLKGSNVEFLAYRIIYTILQGIKYDMENLLRDVKSMGEDLGKKMEVCHALKVMKAINTNNYFEFFNLYKIAPNMASFLIEPFLPRLRIKALQVAASGYFTEASLKFLSDKLAFESCDIFLKFLEENSVVLSKDKTKILFKESTSALNNCKLLTAMQVKISNID